jgi:4'-phosphopantetheinyl transferase
MFPAIYWTLVHHSQIPFDRAKGFLSNAEFQKLSTLRFPKRRSEWLLGRWAAKSLVQNLPAYRQYSLDEIEIHNAPEGAPYIRPPGGSISPDCLTISHSDRSALCAVSQDPAIRVGVDLEVIELRSSVFLADYFTQAEQDLVHTYPAEMWETVITLIWSAKESMLKALGVGLRWDTRKVVVHEIQALHSGKTGFGEWQKIQVEDLNQRDRVWSAWWQRRDNFVITLAGFSTVQPDIQSIHLVEKRIQTGIT